MLLIVQEVAAVFPVSGSMTASFNLPRVNDESFLIS